MVNEAGIITDAPLNSYADINFDFEVAGNYTLYHLSYDGPITGLGENLPFDELDGCLSISDGISIVNNICPSLIDDIGLYQVSSTNTITLFNSGTETIDLSNFWLSHKGNSINVIELRNLCGQELLIGPGEYFTFSLPWDIDENTGSVALHFESVHEELLIKDYVQWGGAGQEYESEAIAAGLWSEQKFADSISEGMALTTTQIQDSEEWMMGQPMDCGLTSSADLSESSIRVFPTPVQEVLNVTGLNNNSQSYRYTISDIMGRIVTAGVLNREASINLSQLFTGSYVLTLQTTNSVNTLKFMKR